MIKQAAGRRDVLAWRALRSPRAVAAAGSRRSAPRQLRRPSPAQPAAQAPPAPAAGARRPRRPRRRATALARTFTAPVGLMFNTVRPERVAEFERLLADVQTALDEQHGPDDAGAGQGLALLQGGRARARQLGDVRVRDRSGGARRGLRPRPGAGRGVPRPGCSCRRLGALHRLGHRRRQPAATCRRCRCPPAEPAAGAASAAPGATPRRPARRRRSGRRQRRRRHAADRCETVRSRQRQR